MVNYLHEIPVKIHTVHSLSVMSVIAPISASSIPSVHPSDNECQEILEEFPGTSYGEKFLAEIMVKIPDNVTLTLYNMKFPEKTLDNSNEGNHWGEFLSG